MTILITFLKENSFINIIIFHKLVNKISQRLSHFNEDFEMLALKFYLFLMIYGYRPFVNDFVRMKATITKKKKST